MIPVAFLVIDMAQSTRASEAEKNQFRHTVRRIVRSFGGTILPWHGDGTVAFFPSEEAAEESAVKAGRQIMERLLFGGGLSAHLAVSSDIVPCPKDWGTLDSKELNRCGHLGKIAPSNALLISVQAYNALSSSLQEQFNYLGTTQRDACGTYVFPKSAKVQDFSTHFVSEGKELGRKRQHYLQFLKDSYRRLTYAGIQQLEKMPSLELLEVFEPLEVKKFSYRGLDFGRIKRRPGKDEGSEKAFLDDEMMKGFSVGRRVEEPPKAFRDVFRGQRHVIVLGDPGMGKTTLLKWLALIYAQGRKGIWPLLGLSEPLLPILASLGDLIEIRKRTGGVPSLPEILACYYEERGQRGLVDLFEEALDGGAGLVLLDGLDEVREPSDRLEASRYVEASMTSFSKNRLVITSRVVGYEEIFFPGKDVYELMPFGPSQKERFLKNWCVAYEKFMTGESQEAEKSGQKNAKALIEAIEGHPKIRDLTKNPFLLSMSAIVHRQGSMLPRYRAELYQLISKTLIQTWDRVRSLGMRPLVSTTRDYQREAREILYPVGLWMHRNFPTGAAPEEKLREFLLEEMKRRGSISRKEAENFVEKFFQELRPPRTHLLVERGQGWWGFLHLAFQEYFAAASLVSNEEYIEKIKDKDIAYDPRWQEVILLIAGELAINHVRTKAVREMIERIRQGVGDKLYEEILKKHILLAGKCLGEIGGIGGKVEDEIVADLLELALRSDFDTLRAEASKVLAALRDSPSCEKIVACCLSALKDEHESVRGSAAEVLGRLGVADKRVVESLLDALKDKEWSVRWSAAEALGRLGVGDKQVIEALVDGLMDMEGLVRGSAAEALGRLGVADDRVVEALLGALKDKNRWCW
ncbi:MAG: HEAT repeat domain-containing protein, partial [Deltaproteobacteria bacterium]|nr:HEAT repeat domain-containing protein [Deltaproteobacteria bacterium]